MRTRACALALFAALAPTGVASACPDCDASRAARSAVWNDPSFATYLAFTVLPIALIAVVAMMLYRAGAPPRSGDAASGGAR